MKEKILIDEIDKLDDNAKILFKRALLIQLGIVKKIEENLVETINFLDEKIKDA